jgi:hypothetical protein
VQQGEEGKGTKGRERIVGKVAEDECVLIPGERAGLADEAGSEAMLAVQDRVTHRYGKTNNMRM